MPIIPMDNYKFTTPTRPLTWLITGCSSGFGLAIARHAQANGHKVIATSRNPSKTPDLVQEIESNGGRWLPLDLDDRDNASVINNLEAEGVAIDVLVNNAGFALLHAAEFITEDEARAQFETVFFGPYRLTRAVLPHMRKRRFGVIVNISTGASLEGRESMGIYSASKAAFDGTLSPDTTPSIRNERTDIRQQDSQRFWPKKSQNSTCGLSLCIWGALPQLLLHPSGMGRSHWLKITMGQRSARRWSLCMEASMFQMGTLQKEQR